jgi:hypothetical protein
MDLQSEQYCTSCLNRLFLHIWYLCFLNFISLIDFDEQEVGIYTAI